MPLGPLSSTIPVSIYLSESGDPFEETWASDWRRHRSVSATPSGRHIARVSLNPHTCADGDVVTPDPRDAQPGEPFLIALHDLR